MKTFRDFLTESKKTYEFKVGIAGELPEGIEDRMETALQKFGLQKLTPGKKTPIQERPLDFPQLENTEVTYFETELTYPTTAHVIQEYLGDFCSVDKSHIIVRNPNEPQELYQEEKVDSAYEARLTKEELEDISAQESVADNRIMNLLKELETARKENTADPIKDIKAGESKDIDDKQNTKSPIGS